MAAIAEPGGGISQEVFEARRRAIALSILEKTDEFMRWDLDFNKHISELAAVLVEQVKRNPRILESNGNLQEIIRDLNAKAGAGPGLSGGDIVGGDVWGDIWGVIKDLLTGEKDFIKEIISKLLNL
jgi:hypothetical protein